jgi:hypothetical protein
MSFLQKCLQNVSCETNDWSLLLVILELSSKLRDVSPVYLGSVKNRSDSMITHSRSINRFGPLKQKSEVSESVFICVIRE